MGSYGPRIPSSKHRLCPYSPDRHLLAISVAKECQALSTMCLVGAGFQMFLRYLENNPVRARMARKATDWRWSSARAHCAGKDAGGVLCLDVWRHLFGNPAVAAEAWTTFLEGPAEEVRRNAGRRPVPYNRVAWSVPVVTLRAGSPPG